MALTVCEITFFVFDFDFRFWFRLVHLLTGVRLLRYDFSFLSLEFR